MRWIVAAIVFSALTSSCSRGDTPTSASSSGDHERLPRLALQEPARPGDVDLLAFVNGELTVNDAGCFALGDELLVAPYGSVVLADGAGIDIPGLGVVKIGETITGGGGHLDYETEATVPKKRKGCFTGPPFRYVLLNPYTF